MVEFTLRTRAREEFVDITSRVQALLDGGEINGGAILVYCPHTTAGLTINENADPDVARDMIEVLRRLVPCNGGYRHREGNSDAHVKATLVGSSVAVPVEDDRLALGAWQGIYFCEFDGPRTRRVRVQVLKG